MLEFAHDRRKTPGRMLLGSLAVPPMLLLEAPGQVWKIEFAGLAVVSLMAMLVARWVARGSTATALASLGSVIAGAGLMATAANPFLRVLASLLVGYGSGGLVSRRRPTPGDAVPCVAFVALFAAVTTLGGFRLGWVVIAVVAALAFPNALREAPAPRGGRLSARLWNGWVLLQTAGFILVSGATSPAATWFGTLETHGSRDASLVAITFDDGPNGRDTLAIASALEAGGARGTFFEVGKAVEAQPDVAQALIERGHLVENHSYEHGRWDYLRPGYAEFQRAERVYREILGVCPALYRPPHGAHSPFVSREVSNNGATVVTWDVEAGDWATTDSDALAKDILGQVGRGSIILLHDGLDGQPGADRSVVVRALPAILDGLRARGLRPVLLDELLGKPAYLRSC